MECGKQKMDLSSEKVDAFKGNQQTYTHCKISSNIILKKS